MTPEAYWGLAFIVYVAIGLWINSSAPGQPPTTIFADSASKRTWEALESKHSRHLLIWCAGLIVLIALWYFTRKA